MQKLPIDNICLEPFFYLATTSITTIDFKGKIGYTPKHNSKLNMMFGLKTKNIALVSILFFLFLAVPLMTVFADCTPQSCQSIVSGGPIVCCGNEGYCPCTFEDIFITINRVIDFILYVVIPPFAVVAIVMASINLLTSAGNPEKLEAAKRTIVWLVIGLIIVYSAWFLVTSFVSFIGGANWTLQFFNR